MEHDGITGQKSGTVQSISSCPMETSSDATAMGTCTFRPPKKLKLFNDLYETLHRWSCWCYLRKFQVWFKSVGQEPLPTNINYSAFVTILLTTLFFVCTFTGQSAQPIVNDAVWWKGRVLGLWAHNFSEGTSSLEPLHLGPNMKYSAGTKNSNNSWMVRNKH